MRGESDLIEPDVAVTLAGLFDERVRRTPDAPAYLHWREGRWEATTWGEMAALAARWQEGLRREELRPGERVAVMLRNCREWVLFDQAAAGLGLVTVPLYVNDRPANFVHILRETEARLLLIEGEEQWQRVAQVSGDLAGVRRIVSLLPACSGECADPRLLELESWLPPAGGHFLVHGSQPAELATIVYTSGTTGTPKGVMLSHANILENSHAGVRRVPVRSSDLFLSFLPLSHTLERTAGYYAPMMAGACVAHARSIDKLAEDLTTVRPTVIVSVPRIFERVHSRILSQLSERPALFRHLFYLAVNVGWRRFNRAQGRDGWTPWFLAWPLLKRLVADRVMAGFGGRLRVAICGGAPLSPAISRVFIGLGVNILQGYGLTEASPVVSVNTEEENLPATVGKPLPGVETRVATNGELLVRGPNVMLGYWRNQAATEAVIDREGWLHTGDTARIEPAGQITITGRLKEIIVLSTGEKIPPEELELAIAVHPLFEQVLVVGEGRPYLGVLAVLNEREWEKLARKFGLDPGLPESLTDARVEQAALEAIAGRLVRFPGYARIRRVFLTTTPWSVTDGLITATLKQRRRQILERFSREVEGLYAGH